MEYSHLLALIDGYRDILHRTRQLLDQDRASKDVGSAAAKKRRAMRSTPRAFTKLDAPVPQPEAVQHAVTLEKPFKNMGITYLTP